MKLGIESERNGAGSGSFVGAVMEHVMGDTRRRRRFSATGRR